MEEIIEHPWNGVSIKVPEHLTDKDLADLILKCGKHFDTIEVRNDGWIATGHIYPVGKHTIEHRISLRGEGASLQESVEDLYSQIQKHL